MQEKILILKINKRIYISQKNEQIESLIKGINLEEEKSSEKLMLKENFIKRKKLQNN